MYFSFCSVCRTCRWIGAERGVGRHGQAVEAQTRDNFFDAIAYDW